MYENKIGRCMCYEFVCTTLEDEYEILCKENLEFEDIKYIQEYVETHIRSNFRRLHIESPVIEKGVGVRRTVFIFY